MIIDAKKIEEITSRLNQQNDPVCKEAADLIIEMDKRYRELGRSYDAMSSDLLKLYEEYRKLGTSSDERESKS